ncbi:GtrA family protein [Streptococcus caprae]|uniref:GtrA family protein n=1 Tax=Streptococcus caprae TaxID=1640501 RepID=A0ABV8CVA9_9STRE
MYIIIPSYEPDQRLIKLIQDITNKISDASMLVINDGSGVGYDTYFHEAERLGATVLTHEINKGKGAALKTAFTYIQDHGEADNYMVTVDSDGQHLIKDIVRVARVGQTQADKIVLGARAFVGKVPARSKFGNKVTAGLFGLVTGEKITDTQTGLRGLSASMIPWLLTLEGDRFEYEFNMLLEAHNAGYGLSEVPIETVYLEENKSSHFRPIQDSIRIYAPFLKFSGTAMTAALVDAILLFVFMAITKNLLVSVVLARVLSAALQCFLNANLVFKKTDTPLKSIIRYAMLVVVILTCNYLLIQGLVNVGIGLVIAKLITEISLFILSYRVQKTVVFA